jgi:hypothetical protein
MSKSVETQPEETSAPSAKRQLAATVSVGAVTVVLGIAAQVLISKVANRVHNQIIPEETDTNE